MRIVFLGTPYFINPVLKKLEESFEVVEKITTPQKMDDTFAEKFKLLKPDLFVVAAYGQILPESILKIPSLGAINIHPSLLPKYRGPSPIQTAILNGDKVTGVSFIKMDKEVDHGEIIAQFEAEIEDDDTFETLAQRLFMQASEKISDVIKDYSKNQKSETQDDSKATFTKSLTRADGYIELSDFKIENLKFNIALMIRAYYPWPGVWTKWQMADGKWRIVKFLPQEKLQVEGKRPVSFKDFINGYPNADKQLIEFLEGLKQ